MKNGRKKLLDNSPRTSRRLKAEATTTPPVGKLVGKTKKKGSLEKSEKLKGQTILNTFLELNNKAKNTPTSQQPSSEVLCFKAKNSKLRWKNATTEAEKSTGTDATQL